MKAKGKEVSRKKEKRTTDLAEMDREITEGASISGNNLPVVDSERKRKKIEGKVKERKTLDVAEIDTEVSEEESVSSSKEDDLESGKKLPVVDSGKKKKINLEGKEKKRKNMDVAEIKTEVSGEEIINSSKDGGSKRKKMKINIGGMMKEKKNTDIGETDAVFNDDLGGKVKEENIEEKVKVNNPEKKKRKRKKYEKKPGKCDECGQEFADKKNLHRHKRSHTGEKPYMCHECGERYTRPDALEYHMSVHRDNKRIVTHRRKGSVSGSESCQICGKTFRSAKGYLTIHMRTHTGERPYSCNECGRSFVQKGAFDIHMRIHTGEKPLICKECGKTFTQHSNLKKHMKNNHGEMPPERPFSCLVCGKTFVEKYNLGKHMKRHTGERPFSCEKCGKAFAEKFTLTIHLATHTEEKPFSCLICGKSYSNKYENTRHMKTHTKEKSFSCTKCEESFGNKASLLTHMKTAHDISDNVTETKRRIIDNEDSSRSHKSNVGGTLEYQTCVDNAMLDNQFGCNVKITDVQSQYKKHYDSVSSWEIPEPNWQNHKMVWRSQCSISAENFNAQTGIQPCTQVILPQPYEGMHEFTDVNSIGTPMFQQPVTGVMQEFQVQTGSQNSFSLERPLPNEQAEMGTQGFDDKLGVGTKIFHGNTDIGTPVIQNLERRMPVYNNAANIGATVFQKTESQKFPADQGTFGGRQVSHNVGTHQFLHCRNQEVQEKDNLFSSQRPKQLEPIVPCIPPQREGPVSPNETVENDTVTSVVDLDTEELLFEPNVVNKKVNAVSLEEKKEGVLADVKNTSYYDKLLARIAPFLSNQLELPVLSKPQGSSDAGEERTRSIELAMSRSISFQMAALDSIMDQRAKARNASLSFPLFLRPNEAKSYFTGERPVANMTNELDPGLERLVESNKKHNFIFDKVSFSLDEVNHLIKANYRNLEILSLMDWTLGFVLGDLKKLKEVIPVEHKQSIQDSIGFIELLNRAEQHVVGEVTHSYASSVLKKREHIVNMMSQSVSNCQRAKLLFDKLSTFAVFDEKLVSKLVEEVSNTWK